MAKYQGIEDAGDELLSGSLCLTVRDNSTFFANFWTLNTVMRAVNDKTFDSSKGLGRLCQFPQQLGDTVM